jgi:hypothetical protein
MESNADLRAGDLKAQGIEQELYQSMVGSVIYAMLGTQPELAYPISILSRFNARPTTAHYKAAKRTLRYLQPTKNFEITYGENPYNNEAIQMLGYSDSD